MPKRKVDSVADVGNGNGSGSGSQSDAAASKKARQGQKRVTAAVSKGTSKGSARETRAQRRRQLDTATSDPSHSKPQVKETVDTTAAHAAGTAEDGVAEAAPETDDGQSAASLGPSSSEAAGEAPADARQVELAAQLVDQERAKATQEDMQLLASAHQRNQLLQLWVTCVQPPVQQPAPLRVPSDASVRFVKREIERKTRGDVPVEAQRLKLRLAQAEERDLPDFDENGAEVTLPGLGLGMPGPHHLSMYCIDPQPQRQERLASRLVLAAAQLRDMPAGNAGRPAAAAVPLSPTTLAAADQYVAQLHSQPARTPPRPSTERLKWTEAEVELLVAGVERYGLSNWARIKADNSEGLAARSAVDLKDKWRILERVVKNNSKSRSNLSADMRTRIMQCLHLVQ
ncbi:hypothetical protein WJX72_009766 [[Myrmecia] bisecta]|uniref:Myb-like domain-containing protein n=1 Tax=[Myrmecia] bisecta TaxID=41462 RepID=A0AAW1Q9U9_9CHLO